MQSNMPGDMQSNHPETPDENTAGNEVPMIDAGEDLDTRGESGNVAESQGSSAGPGEAASGRNKTMEVRQGRSEA